MKLPLSLIKQFIDIKIPPERLAEDLTLSGTKVESVEKSGKDYIFDFEITTNRGDLLGALGVAREISAVYNIPLKSFKHPLPSSKPSKDLEIRVASPADCPRYIGIFLKGVEVEKSPKWLQNILKSSGLKPVNNVVDITNYIMLKYGQPAHAFDAAELTRRIAGKKPVSLTVRRAKRGERLTTIDHEKRVLTPNHLIIADGKGPVALAGVMGGTDTKILSTTTSIVLEIANFNSKLVRRAEMDFNLRTESSKRFEKGLDETLPAQAIREAIDLLERIAGAQLISAIDKKTKPPREKTIKLHLGEVERILGVKIPQKEIISILNRLGAVTPIKSGRPAPHISYTPPSHRKDLQSQADLIEEIVRIYGLINIPPTIPSGEIDPTPLESQTRYKQVLEIKRILSLLGLNEAYTFSLTKNEAEGRRQEARKVINPLSQDNAYLRTSLLAGLLESADLNRPNFEEFGLFEIGKVFPPSKTKIGLESEPYRIAAIRVGPSSEGSDPRETSQTFLQLKGILEELFKKTGVKIYELIPSTDPLNHTAQIRIGNKKVGEIKYIDQETSAFEIDLKPLLSHTSPLYRPYPTYPPYLEDLSFTVEEGTHIGTIISKLKKISSLIQDISIIDTYEVGGKRSVTLRITYQSLHHSLSSYDIKPIRKKQEVLLKNSNARIRE